MDVIDLSIPEVKLIKPRLFSDDRGFFMQSYQEQQYQAAGFDMSFVQDNRSRSSRGVLRGLHYQLEHAQDKLVSVIRGEVFDVAVDIRRGSPTFGRWVGEVLSDENHHQLFVPKGFAHGFLVLSETVDLAYKCSDFYAPGDEYGILWSDPNVGIEWPVEKVLLSSKDEVLTLLSEMPLNLLPAY